MSHADTKNLVPGERVLATLNPDGSRHWICPRVSPGRFLSARRIVAWLLIAIFAAIPFIKINGYPAMLLDVAGRRFHLFGATFLSTDTALMAVLMLIIFLTIFLVTAMLGRVWCGWACPQTVYMEFLYRPIERLIDGPPGSRRASTPHPGATILKYLAYFVCSCFLAHTFLAYFVGVEQLRVWVTRSPAEHPSSFLIMFVTTALMMFDFSYFREQTCLVACPYGRFQSALTDRHTMTISYDERRGEPRGKKHAPAADVALRVLPENSPGDCVDCFKCVTTCPTGIDIRNGPQMECIGCAQCIDACDSVMDKLGRARGLIRYSSAAILSGQAKRLIRPRVILYPALLLGFVGLFLYLLLARPSGEAAILPRQGLPFYSLPSGEIANQVRMRLVNRDEKPATFTVSLPPEALALGVRLAIEGNPFTLLPAESHSTGFVIEAPSTVFSGRGAFETHILVTADSDFEKKLPFRMLGPAGSAKPATQETKP